MQRYKIHDSINLYYNNKISAVCKIKLCTPVTAAPSLPRDITLTYCVCH